MTKRGQIERPRPIFALVAPDEPVKRLELHLTYECCNDCVFCSERDHMREFAAHPASMAEVESVLKVKRAEGYEHVTFTGGEPTLFPKIWKAVESAKTLGYRTFLISNGSALAVPEFSASILPFLDEICLSLHGHDEESHVRETRNPKSFARMLAALENIERHPKDHFLMINHVLTRRNLPHLAMLLRFVTGYAKVRNVLLSQPAPMGGAKDGYPDLCCKHAEITARLPELRGIAKGRGVALRVYGMPVCVLGEHWECANDLYFSPRLTVARTWNPDGTPGWFEEDGRRPTRERFFPEACGPCPIRGRCGGIYRQYWDQIEKSVLTPFKIPAV